MRQQRIFISVVLITLSLIFVVSRQLQSVLAKPVMPTASAQYDVLIIGAGLSGMIAAQRLVSRGYRVMVLEATERVGGRALTDHRFSAPIDLGASWLHSADLNPLTALVDSLGLTRVQSELDGPVFIGAHRLSDAELKQFHSESARLNDKIADVVRSEEDQPLSELLTSVSRYRALISANIAPLDNGTEAQRASSLEVGLFRADPDDLILEGVGTMVERLARGLPITLNQPVTQVSYSSSDGAGVTLTTLYQGRSKSYQARRVIVTASTGVLAARKIEFQPDLPQWKWDAIRALPMGLLNKVIIQLKAGGLKDEKGDQWVLVQESPAPDSSVMAFLIKPHNEPLVIGFYGADQARRFEARGETAALNHAKSMLKRVYGVGLGAFIDESRAAVTRWGSQPWALGSYSAALPHQSHQREVLARPVSDRVFFAGEACGPPELNGSLGAAYVAGLMAARAVHKSLTQAH